MDRAGRPLRLLSIDGGGGLRGYSALTILDHLCDTISSEEKALGLRAPYDDDSLRPCEYFDLIGGTGVGGLIGVLLGRLRLDIKSCINVYDDILKAITECKEPSSAFGLALSSAPKFSVSVLENAVKRALKSLGYHEDELMWDDSLFEDKPDVQSETNESPILGRADSIWHQDTHDLLNQPIEHDLSAHDSLEFPNLEPTIVRVRRQNTVQRKDDRRGCRAFMLTSVKTAMGIPRALSTYDPNNRRMRIWEATCATCATPEFFGEFSFGVPPVTYLESGIGLSNPAGEVDHAAKELWEQRSIGVIVSIGMGLRTMPHSENSWLQFPLSQSSTQTIVSVCAKQAISIARVENEMNRRYFATEVSYFRYDNDRSLPNVSLEQWLKEGDATALTEHYVRDPVQVQSIRQCAGTIVGLTADPIAIDIPAERFTYNVTGKRTGHVIKEGVGFTHLDTGKDNIRERARCLQRPGIILDDLGETRLILPVPSRKEGNTAQVYSCVRAQEVCFKSLCNPIASGWYTAVFVMCFWETDVAAPEGIIFSAGTPRNASDFMRRWLDVRITPDAVPVLLDEKVVRARLGRSKYESNIGKGWLEVTLREKVYVGSGGQLGLVVNAIFKKGTHIGGWTFGGVRLVPTNASE
ncbi:FabD/lysophospholipase-like protein [Macroventuria anomochaeta]|uniref:FabD/lysophospholipase-like protein n=1 Tax=Macroventuria anomochaeta TaxID=301207 RepID=A0ACB6S1U5_9PLEO|nr:FabD/lysophospholipase-like protein [Macroventuria anomochaeta]KAF2628008.1 FabD/lysophospholipase-like protein [Macroventuria anomochaeta]